jgi:MFS superfamily sulfate permease-like transporter
MFFKLSGKCLPFFLVTFAITVTLGMVFASKHNYSVAPNQEFKALGVGNIIGAWFQCFPSGASLARSAVQDDSGGRTQVCSNSVFYFGCGQKNVNFT